MEAWALSNGGMLATIENDAGYLGAARGGYAGAERGTVVALPEGVVSDLAWSFRTGGWPSR